MEAVGQLNTVTTLALASSVVKLGIGLGLIFLSSFIEDANRHHVGNARTKRLRECFALQYQ